MSSSSAGGGAGIASSSAYSNGSGAVGSVPNVPGTSLGTTLDGLRALVAKRITAWTYLKNAGEGRVYWFNVRSSSASRYPARTHAHPPGAHARRRSSSRPKT